VLWQAGSRTKYCCSPKINNFGPPQIFGLAAPLSVIEFKILTCWHSDVKLPCGEQCKQQLKTSRISSKVLQLQNSATSTTDLCEILIAATCTLTSSSPPPTTATITVPTEVELHGNTHHCQVVVTPAAGHTCPRCRKKTASAVGGLCQRCTFVLSDSWHLWAAPVNAWISDCTRCTAKL